jgi:hypothetical protein
MRCKYLYKKMQLNCGQRTQVNAFQVPVSQGFHFYCGREKAIIMQHRYRDIKKMQFHCGRGRKIAALMRCRCRYKKMLFPFPCGKQRM